MKLLSEYVPTDMDVIIEQKNPNTPRTVKIKGPYISAEVKNANGRIYKQSLLEKVVDEYKRTMIDTNRAVGELNHPSSIQIDYNNVCHRIIDLKQDKNIWIGESIILTGTPKGDIIASLLDHGTKIGVSTRGVGSINESGIIDREYKLITVDLVSDPSGSGCFVNGIYEAKNYMINQYGDIVEVLYNKLDKGLSHLPKHNSNEQVVNLLKEFIKSI